MRRRFFFLAPFILLAFVGFIALGGLVVRQLWNWLLPPLFGLHAVTYWQALGLLALCRILFGSLGLHPSPGAGMRRRMAGRWGAMSAEERERLRRGWGGGERPATDEGIEA